MSAFDEARRAGGRAGGGRSAPTSRSGVAVSSGGAGAIDVGASAASLASYQNADRGYLAVCEAIERELKKLTALVAATQKQVDAVGTPKDSLELRKKIEAGIQKGKELSKAVSAQLRDELPALADASELTPKERSGRKIQQTRYMNTYKEAVAAFTQVGR